MSLYGFLFMLFAEFGDFDTLARDATVQLYSKSFVNYRGYHSFYPLMNFSCPGNITKVSFITNNTGSTSDASLPRARFATWSVSGKDVRHFVRRDYADAQRSLIINTTDSYRLYELTLNNSSWIQFDINDVFGIRLPWGSLNPLHQVRGGWNQYTVISEMNYNREEFRIRFLNTGLNFPLVSLETGKNAVCLLICHNHIFMFLLFRQLNLC